MNPSQRKAQADAYLLSKQPGQQITAAHRIAAAGGNQGNEKNISKPKNTGTENMLDDLKREIRREELRLKKQADRESRSKRQPAERGIGGVP